MSEELSKVDGRRKVLLTRDRSFYSTLLALAVPIALQNLVTFCVNLADNLMVASIGDSAVSGVYIGNQLQTVLLLFAGGLEAAVLVLAAQYWGRKDRDSIRKIAAIGVKLALAVGILFTLAALLLPEQIVRIFIDDEAVVEDGATYLRIVGLSYIFFCLTQIFIAVLRSVEVAKIGLWVSLISLGTNIGLNYLLIFGVGPFPELGIRGAAIATLISRIVELAVLLLYVRFRDVQLKLRLKDLLPTDKTLLKDYIHCLLPILGGNMVWSVNMLANTKILGTYGSAEIMTAVSVAMSLNNLIFVWNNGLSGAVSVITGKTVGAGKYELMKEYARTVQIVFLCVGLFSGGMLFLLREPFLMLYPGISEGAQAYARQFITVVSVTALGTCYQATCLMGLVKAGGDISFVFKNDTIFVFGVVLPSAIIAKVLGASPWLVFGLLKVDQILKCFVAVVKINSFNWMKNLTRSAEADA